MQMSDTDREKMRQAKERIREWPLFEYACLDTKEIPFSQRVRYICEKECPRYGTSWSCPPAVGTVEECRERCLGYRHAFVFSTISEPGDPNDPKELRAARLEHVKITEAVREIFRDCFGRVLALSAESCDICGQCTYPDAPCRYPDRMFPCAESYGILVTELAGKTGMTFEAGSGTIIWFSVIFWGIH